MRGKLEGTVRLNRFAFSIVLLLGALPSLARPDDPKEEIKAVVFRYAEAVRSGDIATLEALLDENAILMPADRPRVEGHKAALAFWTEARSLRMSRIVQSVEVSGDLAWATGIYNHRRTPMVTVPPSNNFLVTLKRETDGSWRVVRDIWNGSESGVVPAR